MRRVFSIKFRAHAAMRHTNYDSVAATYDRRYVDEDFGGIEGALIEFLGDAPGKVLEVGCGTGHWLRRLDERHIKATGIDPSQAMLAHARAKVTAGGLIRARAEDLPLATGRFNRLFCINAFHHFAVKRAAVNEARRVLGRGGAMMTIALDPHTGIDRWWVYDYFPQTLEIDKQRYPSCEQIREWMRDAGFLNTYSREVQHLPDDVLAVEALQNGTVSPGHTSQLAVLTSDEFSAGVARIHAALAADRDMHLSADLRVYATYGTAG
jgi:ubiquinone/menaquinone biosynthesis C-methylase UbiE